MELHNTAAAYLDRLRENIFVQPYASAGKDSRGIFAPARRVTKNYALGLPNIQINGPRQKRYLSFDIDREFAGMAWDAANLPIPNLIITNPENGHAHLVYELTEPVWEPRKAEKRSGEPKPLRYYKAVSRAMQTALDADTHYNGLLVKNPFHSDWDATCGRLRPYTLGELSEHLELSAQPESRLKLDSEGRNCSLFHSLRYWAYRAKAWFKNLVSFRDAADRELAHLNDQLDQPLGPAELRGIAKSVTKWVWNRYTGMGQTKRRGICQLDQSLNLSHRQQLGQTKTAEIKVTQTRIRINIGIEKLVKQGLRITKTAVAKATRLSRSTIHRHWSHFFPAKLEVHSAITLGTVTEEETVSLRDRSLVPPAGACGPAARERPSDPHPKRHFFKTRVGSSNRPRKPRLPEVERILALIRAQRPPPPERPPDPVHEPDPTSVLLVRRAIDRIHERTSKRLN